MVVKLASLVGKEVGAYLVLPHGEVVGNQVVMVVKLMMVFHRLMVMEVVVVL